MPHSLPITAPWWLCGLQSKNLRDSNGATAMHIVSARGDIEMAKILCHIPFPDLSVADNKGMTPMHTALVAGHRHIVDFFVSQHPPSAVVNALSEHHGTILHTAIERNDARLVKILLQQCHADPTIYSKHLGETPLLVATRLQQVTYLCYLSRLGI